MRATNCDISYGSADFFTKTGQDYMLLKGQSCLPTQGRIDRHIFRARFFPTLLSGVFFQRRKGNYFGFWYAEHDARGLNSISIKILIKPSN